MGEWMNEWMNVQEQPPEMFYEKGVLKISQDWLENTCGRPSFLINFQALNLYLKRDPGAGDLLSMLLNF